MPSSKATPPRVTPASIGAQLDALERALAPLATLSLRQRKTIRDRLRPVPDALVELVLGVTEAGGGRVGGVPLDVEEVRATRAEIAAARTAAEAARRIAAKMEDDALRKEVLVGDQVFAIYRALRYVVRTPAGEPLTRAREEMAALVRETQRPRRAKPPRATAAKKRAPTA